MGCPVGIGPEIILNFFSHQNQFNTYFPLVIGDIKRLEEVSADLGFTKRIVLWHPGDEIDIDSIPVLNMSSLLTSNLSWGKPNAETGKAMAGYIEKAVSMIKENWIQAMVTCPITKTAFKMAGIPYPGHTEMLACLSGSSRYKMMMAGSSLKVVLVTIHEPLSKVSSLLSIKSVIECIQVTVDSLKNDFGISNPKVAVCGLNPHAGEAGMFGDEENQTILPAINRCALSAEISGPWPPDTIFHRAASGDFDAVVAMYHDQGLIPFKLLHFSDGVNVTLGLPIVRTSVDHGTAYDIAGKGIAEASSLTAAWHLACDIIDNRTQNI